MIVINIPVKFPRDPYCRAISRMMLTVDAATGELYLGVTPDGVSFGRDMLTKISVWSEDKNIAYTCKASENKVYAGIVIPSPDTPEGYINEEIEIQVKSGCKTDIKSIAYYKLKDGTTNKYEFSGNIYKVFYDDGKIIGRTVILGKTDNGVKIAEGFSIDISTLIPSESTLTPDVLKDKYNEVENEVEESKRWKTETEFGTKNFDDSGYILLKITENGAEITKDNPGYIRVRK